MRCRTGTVRGSRVFRNFLKDLRKRPDKVRKVVDLITDVEIERYEKMAEEVDGILMIHIDGNYTDDMDLFARLRPKRTILQFDGFTDTFAIADEMVKHEICMWGDIPPQMLSMGTPEEVYNRCMELKKRYGPGLILSAGCSYPPNTKIENLLAMKEAAENMNF